MVADPYLRKQNVNLAYNVVLTGSPTLPHRHLPSPPSPAPPKKPANAPALNSQSSRSSDRSKSLDAFSDASIPLASDWKFSIDFVLHRSTANASEEDKKPAKASLKEPAPPLPPAPAKSYPHPQLPNRNAITRKPIRSISQPWRGAPTPWSQNTRIKHYSNGTDVPLLTVAAYTPQILSLRHRHRSENLHAKSRSTSDTKPFDTNSVVASMSTTESSTSRSAWDMNVFDAAQSETPGAYMRNKLATDSHTAQLRRANSTSLWQSSPKEKELLYASQSNLPPPGQTTTQHSAANADTTIEYPEDTPQDVEPDQTAARPAQIGGELFPRRVHPKGRYASKPPPHQPGEPECMRPRPQRPKFPADLYTPAVVRAGKSSGKGEAAGGIGSKEGWCGLCPPAASLGVPNPESHVGGWLNLRNSSYRYHLIRAHGISPKTYKPFTEPVEVQRRDAQLEAKVGEGTELRGRCHQCNTWVIFGLTEATNFYVHASKCHRETIAGDGADTSTDSSASASGAPTAVEASGVGSGISTQGAKKTSLPAQPLLSKNGVRILGASSKPTPNVGSASGLIPQPNPRVIRPARGTTAALSRPLLRRQKRPHEEDSEDQGRRRAFRTDEDKENVPPARSYSEDLPDASSSGWGATESRSLFGRVRRLREGQMLE